MGSCLSFESRNPVPNSPLGVRKRKNSKKKNSGSRSSSFDCKREDLLHKIPGRMFLNGSSEMASLFTQQGKKGTNQDAMIVWENFGSRSDTVFCGVFDGHGPYGHMVARRVRDSLPLKLISHWEGNSKSDINVDNNTAADNMNSESTSLLAVVDEDEEEEGRVSKDERDKNRDIFQDLKELFLKAFKVMDRELKFHTNFDSFCSGTTAVTLIKQGQHLVIGNVGDSRAVLGTRNKDNSITPVQLTVDLKPNLPKEAERIRKCRGRVFSLQDEPDVSRVWLPNNDSPGLAMARAFGDFCLKDFGLISIPEITYRCLSDKDEFVVMATDGVWDVLSNEEVVNVVSSAPSRALAARSLVEQAVRAWRYKYPTSKVDDCAVVCFFLDVNKNNVSTANSIKKVASNDHSINNKEHNLVPAGLDHSATTRKVGEESEDDDEEDEEDDDLMDFEESGMEWSALEGVARVNTLLTLPRFDPGKERKGADP